MTRPVATAKANLDIEIVVDMFNTVEQYDRVVLFSGDGDFERAIHYAQRVPILQ